jgi:dihydrofolate reductase
MAELIADLFLSADGYAAGKDVGAFFGLPGPDLDEWVRVESERPQVMVMGRVTYELMAAMPSSASMNDLPKAVYSNTLQEPLAWQNTTLLRGDLADAFRTLKQSDTPLRTIGSLKLVHGLMALGLVDQLRLMIFPLTLGADGHEPTDFPRAGLELIETKVLDSRLVLLNYRPVCGP